MICRSTSSSRTYGLSGGYSESETGSGGNGGANFSVSDSTRTWVNEQSSLTGASVSIYVEDKTTLKGAVIASTTNDLTLSTGSFEYENIKDKDVSYSFGAGVSGGTNYTSNGTKNEKNNSGSVSANYGYSDARQTNFATIGGGEITVRDGMADLTGLNRDVTLAQYGTVDVGLHGGFVVDTSTVKLLLHPIKTSEDLVASLKQGYADGKETTGKIVDEVGEAWESAKIIVVEKLHLHGYEDPLQTDYTSQSIIIQYIKDKKGNIVGRIDTTLDGYNKTIYKLDADGTVTSVKELCYTNDNGTMKLYSESLESYGKSVTKELISYDDSGKREYETVVYSMNSETGNYEMQKRRVLMLDVNGNAFDLETKQFMSPHNTIININGSGRSFTEVGCKLTGESIMISFQTGDNITPTRLYNEALTTPGALSGANFYSYEFVKKYDFVESELYLEGYNRDNTTSLNGMQDRINTNIANKTPTMVRYGQGNDTHFVIIGGLEYNEEGTITNYIVNDIGTNNMAAERLNGTTLKASNNIISRDRYVRWNGKQATRINWNERQDQE